ncbi:MAG: peptidoglycan-associated lipoprotein Pal [Chromatiales bacterium]|jgi:peptidoglycan-associated lipoprotein|nr:peptidoglycan-associated lipoprotein Pal [Chromatiales bacterium]
MKLYAKLFGAAIPVVLLTACASTQESTLPDSTSGSQGDSSFGAETLPVQGGSGFQGSPLDDPNSLLSKRVIYFEFDRAEVKPDQRAIIEAHAQYLAANRNVRVVLQGHTDERGSREYNMGLGERRANAVRSMMTLQGASASQIDTVSFGEERPVAMGQDEASWSQNRRVEIVYR